MSSVGSSHWQLSHIQLNGAETMMMALNLSDDELCWIRMMFWWNQHIDPSNMACLVYVVVVVAIEHVDNHHARVPRWRVALD